MNPEQWAPILKELENELKLTTLKRQLNPPPPLGSRFYTGTSPAGWMILAVSFSIEDQGFPKGSRGYDGTAVKKGLVIRIPRPFLVGIMPGIDGAN